MVNRLEGKILVVSKYAPTGEAIMGDLSDYGYKSEAIGNGGEALERLGDEHYLGMIINNDKSGLTKTLIEGLKMRDVKCPVLLITEYGVPEGDLGEIYSNLFHDNGTFQYDEFLSAISDTRIEMGMQGVEPRTP